MVRKQPGARKAEILDVAGHLFHRSGFHNVGMDDIGEAAGVTGPALYFHFSSKTALLAAVMERLADELLDTRDKVVAEAKGPAEVLQRLVAHHVDFALNERELIAVWIRDERSLPPPDQRRLRERQRAYVNRWVEALREYNPGLEPTEALSIVHGVFNFIASIAFYEPKLDRERLRDLLQRKATACLLDQTGPPRYAGSSRARKTSG